MSQQTSLKLEISAGHTLEFILGSRALAVDLGIAEHDELVFDDMNAAYWYLENEALLIKYFPAVVLAVIDKTIGDAVRLYDLELPEETMPCTDIIKLTIHRWG